MTAPGSTHTPRENDRTNAAAVKKHTHTAIHHDEVPQITATVNALAVTPHSRLPTRAPVAEPATFSNFTPSIDTFQAMPISGSGATTSRRT